MLTHYLTDFDHWIEQEKKAVELMNLAARLSFDRSTELLLFRKPLFNVSSAEILASHETASRIALQQIAPALTLELTRCISEMKLSPSRIDLGRLAVEWLKGGRAEEEIPAFLQQRLARHSTSCPEPLQSKDVVLYGFGRIGRLLARELIGQTGKGQQLRLRAIVTRSYSDFELSKRAELLRKDSVHGPFKGTVREDFQNKALIINGQRVYMIGATQPEDAGYASLGIKDALLIDNTGVFRSQQELQRHLVEGSIDKVLLTAPGSGEVPNIVCGVNETSFDFKQLRIFSAASCTTNAIVPALQVLHQTFGIEKGHIETIHSYTNDQNLLDNYHKKSRRGRAAALNMVITETGADKAVAKVLPELAGRLTGNAVRVPTPNVSLAILNLSFSTPVNKESLNHSLREAALFGALCEQLDYSISQELVSSDLVGNSHAAVVDAPATLIGKDGKSAVLYLWYDNEYGYSRQVIRLAKKLSGVVRLTYY